MLFSPSERVLSEMLELPPIRGEATGEHGRLIEQIRALCPNISRASLEPFGVRELTSYLAHIEAASTPRGREARWVRTGDTRALVTRSSKW